MNNEAYLLQLKQENERLNGLEIKAEVLCFGDQTSIPGEAFSLEKIINGNLFLKSEISKLSAQELFNLVIIDQKANALIDGKTNSLNLAEQFEETSPKVRLKKGDFEGEYNLIDEHGSELDFNGYAKSDVQRVFTGVFYAKRENTTVKDLEQAIEKHLGKPQITSNQESETNSGDENNQEEQQSFEPKVEAKLVGMNIASYYQMLNFGNPAAKQTEQRQSYEIFMSELIIYEDYLTDDQQRLVGDFKSSMMMLIPMEENLSQFQQQALTSYRAAEISKDKYKYNKSRQANERVATFKHQPQAQENPGGSRGYVNSLTATIFISLLGLVIASIIYMIAH